jgi:hypothetical protein
VRFEPKTKGTGRQRALDRPAANAPKATGSRRHRGKLQFLASALLIALGMWIRLTVVESPIFPTSTRGVSMLPGS